MMLAPNLKIMSTPDLHERERLLRKKLTEISGEIHQVAGEIFHRQQQREWEMRNKAAGQ